MLNKRILVLMFVVAFLFVGCLPTPTPPNEAPIITSTPVTTATIGVLYTYDVNATDPNGDTLTYSLATPGGMTINSATGLIKWTPVTAQIGDNPVSVKVSDGTLSVIQGFTIKVKAVNHAPSIISIPITTATVGVTYVYGVNATDPNNDILTYSLTTCPPGMTISSANGLIMWNPTAEGNYAVVVNVSDGALSDTQGFTVVVSKPTVLVEAYTITASAGTGGTISPIGDVTVIKGIDRLFTITPDTGYSIEKVLVDGSSVGVLNTYTFNDVTKDHAIHATFIAVEPEPEPELELTGIKVSPDAMILLTGGTKSFTVTAHYSDDTAKFVTSACAYGIDDDSIATVEAGKVTALEEVGTATIFINYTEGDITKEANLTVTVGDTITISWGEAAVRYFPDGTVKDSWLDSHDYGADLIKVDGGYSFADINEYFNWLMSEEMGLEGSVVIDETGALSGWATYTTLELDTRNDFLGQVEIIEVGNQWYMVGDYTQWKYVYAESYDELLLLEDNYLKAVLAPEQGTDWWFTSYTEYTAYKE